MSRNGLYVQFEERGAAAGYRPGQMAQQFNNYDPVVGSLVSTEVSVQFDKIKAMGVNTITYELRTADPDTAPSCSLSQSAFPNCRICYDRGLDWPQPTNTELKNLKAFFDLVASHTSALTLLRWLLIVQPGANVLE